MGKQKRPRLTLRFAKDNVRALLADHTLLYLAKERYVNANLPVPAGLIAELDIRSASVVLTKWAAPLALYVLDDVWPYALTYKGSAPFVLITEQIIDEAQDALDALETFFGEKLPPRVHNEK